MRRYIFSGILEGIAGTAMMFPFFLFYVDNLMHMLVDDKFAAQPSQKFQSVFI
jgi:hypothetical protein